MTKPGSLTSNESPMPPAATPPDRAAAKWLRQGCTWGIIFALAGLWILLGALPAVN